MHQSVVHAAPWGAWVSRRAGGLLKLAANPILLSIAFASVARAAPSANEPLSLGTSVELALQIAPEVTSRAANLEALQALAISAGRLPDPQLLIGVDNLPVTGPDAYSTTRDFMTMRKVGVMQEFPRAETRRLERRSAEARSDVADADLVETQLAVARAVAEAWIRRATAEASLHDLRALESDVELQAIAARAAVAAGRSSTSEALSAESAIAELANRILQMQGEARRAALELARWIDADAARPLATMPSLDALPTVPGALVAHVHEHGALLPFESRIEAARIAIDLAKAERRPDFSVELAYAKRGPEFSDMASLQFRVGLPLFTKYRQNPVIRARHAELREIEAERATALRMHAAEIQQVIVDWQVLGEQLQRYEQELLPLARERTRASLASYRAGRSDLRLALDAHQREVELVIERAALRNERGRAWAYLRYLTPQHLPR